MVTKLCGNCQAEFVMALPCRDFTDSYMQRICPLCRWDQRRGEFRDFRDFDESHTDHLQVISQESPQFEGAVGTTRGPR